MPETSTSNTPAHVAIARLVRDHGGKLHAVATRLCGNRDEADDLVQEVFLAAFRHWAEFRGEAAPTTWLYTIAARRCQRMHRKRSGEPRRMARLSDITPFSDVRSLDVRTGEGPLDAQLKREAKEAIQAAIARLPAAYRLPLVFKDILELPVADVAQALGLRENTVKTRVHRARLMLRKVMLAHVRLRPAPAPIYEKQTCIDLLRAKLEAQDRGRRFPIGRDVICERCRLVFAELDLTQDVCADLSRGDLPAKVRDAILARIRDDQPPRNRPRRTTRNNPRHT